MLMRTSRLHRSVDRFNQSKSLLDGTESTSFSDCTLSTGPLAALLVGVERGAVSAEVGTIVFEKA